MVPEPLADSDFLADRLMDNIYRDSFLYEHEWEWVIETLNEEFFPDGSEIYYVEGSNMGWRHQSGWNVVAVDNATEFLRKILGPKTYLGFGCIFRVRQNDDGTYSIINYHHDAPMGERYDICRYDDLDQDTKDMVNDHGFAYE